jgi:hypothetical protein
MTSRTIRTALLPAVVLAALSCSKTQDTAPERRVFGDPPTIQSVDPNYFIAQSPIACDFTQIVSRQLCRLIRDFGGNIQASDIQAQPGCGWFGINQDGTPKMNTVCETRAGIFVEGSYGEASFVATVKDPNSTTDQSNILFVSASFVQPAPSTTEISLVMFDDGAATKFPNAQKVATIGEDCSEEECVCEKKTYGISSGDGTAKDGTYTRKMALVKNTANPYLLDCIMLDRQETLDIVTPGSTLSFKIEAVDRQGNHAEWPQKLTLTTVEDSYTCNGDSCGCCVLQFGGLSSECNRLPGLIIPGFAPDGLCVDIQT